MPEADGETGGAARTALLTKRIRLPAESKKLPPPGKSSDSVADCSG